VCSRRQRLEEVLAFDLYIEEDSSFIKKAPNRELKIIRITAPIELKESNDISIDSTEEPKRVPFNTKNKMNICNKIFFIFFPIVFIF